MVRVTMGGKILILSLLCGAHAEIAAAQGPAPSPRAGRPCLPPPSGDAMGADALARSACSDEPRRTRPGLPAVRAGTVIVGKVRGIAIPYPGTAMAPRASKVARLLWQGKVFDPCESMITNRFFGLKLIKGQVYPGESWMDGRPATIIDYSSTSRLYAPYRDEIREVAPGLYLGIMYERTCPRPTLKTYFLLDARP